jgi:hypothetical protein
MSMSQSDNLHLAKEFLGRVGSGAEPVEIAKLFSENMEWEIAMKPCLASGNRMIGMAAAPPRGPIFASRAANLPRRPFATW